jgi:hypothetical protein
MMFLWCPSSYFLCAEAALCTIWVCCLLAVCVLCYCIHCTFPCLKKIRAGLGLWDHLALRVSVCASLHFCRFLRCPCRIKKAYAITLLPPCLCIAPKCFRFMISPRCLCAPIFSYAVRVVSKESRPLVLPRTSCSCTNITFYSVFQKNL